MLETKIVIKNKKVVWCSGEYLFWGAGFGRSGRALGELGKEERSEVDEEDRASS
jgi:hypothetical protein